jgi:prolyl oligopeptidase
MVRYEEFGNSHKWREEYGSVEIEEEFHALYKYSPYHRIEEDIDYPATLFVTGDKDEQCDPAHVRKMVARMQRRSIQTRAVLVDYSWERGHTPSLPLSVRVESLARRLGFLLKELDIPFSPEKK